MGRTLPRTPPAISRDPRSNAWPLPARCCSNLSASAKRRSPGAGDHRHAPCRRRRPLLPVHAQRGLEPGGGHRQERQLRHRPGRGRARGGRREDRLRLLGRHLEAALLDAAATRHHRRGRPEPAREGARQRKIAASRILYAPLDPIATLDSTQKVALLEKVEKLARAKDPRIVQVMAGLAGEYDVVLVARADGTLAADVRPAGAPVGDGDRRADDRRPGRREVGGGSGRRRPLRPGFFQRRRDRGLRERGGAGRAHQPRIAPGAKAGR